MTCDRPFGIILGHLEQSMENRCSNDAIDRKLKKMKDVKLKE